VERIPDAGRTKEAARIMLAVMVCVTGFCGWWNAGRGIGQTGLVRQRVGGGQGRRDDCESDS